MSVSSATAAFEATAMITFLVPSFGDELQGSQQRRFAMLQAGQKALNPRPRIWTGSVAAQSAVRVLPWAGDGLGTGPKITFVEIDGAGASLPPSVGRFPPSFEALDLLL